MSTMKFATKENLRAIIESLRSSLASKSDAVKSITRSGTTFTATRADGTSFTFTQQDNTVAKTTTTPKMNGTAAVGSETKYAAGDHVHPTDTTRAAASDLTSHTGNTTVHITAAERSTWNAKASTAVATTSANGLMSSDDKTKLNGIASGATANTAASATPKADGTAAVGTSAKYAREDHVHPTDTTRLAASLKGAVNGVAELDSNGKVPSSQLPSYVDDVLEYSAQSAFPSTGESGKIYVDLATNKTYRWSGSAYTEISPSLALGETSSTAYRGDRGKTAYDHAAAKGSAFSSGLYKITTNAHGHVTAATAVAKSDITALGIPAQDTTYTAASAAPKADGTAAVGTSAKYAREDHVHPTDTSRAAASDLTSHTGNTTVHVTAAERSTWNGKTSNTGTVTSVATGAGLTGGTITGSGTIKADLKSETKLTNAAAAAIETAGRVYPVALDKDGDLAVNVPWTDSADKLTGLTHMTVQTWGNQTGTFVTRFDDSSGGSMAVRRDNPASGQMSLLIDGTLYIKEGGVDVGDAIKSITRSGTTFTYTTLWGNTGTFTQQDNNTTYSAGSGLSLSGTTFSAKVDNSTIKVNSSGQLYVALPSLDSTSY